VRLTVSMAEDGSEAAYRSEVLMDGEVIAAQRATVRL